MGTLLALLLPSITNITLLLYISFFKSIIVETMRLKDVDRVIIRYIACVDRKSLVLLMSMVRHSRIRFCI